MWTWDQSAGELWRDGALVSRGYSGKARGRNNPALQGVPGVGPIPRGRWRIAGRYDSAAVGPCALRLHAADEPVPDDLHEATGRSAFRIHGDSIRAPGTASRGCIILPRKVREAIWRSGDRDLEVVE
ncbi:MAG TPA: tlde1 domain-containing protein [Caulobacter sp.]|nr:tlde1 domain-containing protein [Caulobacter sp.]